MAELAKDTSIEAVIVNSKHVVLLVLSLKAGFNYAARKHSLARLLRSFQEHFSSK